jgi:hypothetical protein
MLLKDLPRVVRVMGIHIAFDEKTFQKLLKVMDKYMS